MKIGSSVVAIAAVLAAGVADAQTKGTTPEDVVVEGTLEGYSPEPATGTRTGTPSFEAPVSQEAVGRALIADRGLVTLTDALRQVSGVQPVGGIGGFNTRFRLRGFLSTNNLRNGFRQQLGFPVTEVQNIERVEVLKGPASSLYGRFEPGGAVNIVTKRPLATNRATADLTADDYGLVRGTADVNLVDGDSFGLRLNGVWENGETFRDFVANEGRFGAAAMSAKLGPDTRLFVEGEFARRDGVFDRGFVSNALTLRLPPERFLGDPADRFDNTTAAASATLEHDFSADWRLRLGGSFSRGESNGDYYFPQAAGGAPLVSAAGVLNRRLQTTFDLQRDRTVQAELIGKVSTGALRHTLLAVVDWNEDSGLSTIRRATVNSGLNIFNPVYGGPRAAPTALIVDTAVRNRSVGGIAQVETAWAPWLRTLAGVRVERVTSRLQDFAARTAGRAEATATTPRFGATILPGGGFALYGNYGRSFAPEVSTRPIVGGGQPKPSRGEQFEAGVRWQAPDGRVRASVAGFEITRSNVRVAEPGGSPFDRQVGAQRSRGVEVDIAAQPIAGLTIDLAYAYVDARVTNDPVLAGRQLQSSPEHSANLWARWDVTPRVGVAGGVTLVGDRFVDTQNTFALDGFARADAALFWRPIDRLEVQLNLLNLGDARYFENGNTNNNFYPGQPRTVRGTVRVLL